jgi:hypothetical protein
VLVLDDIVQTLHASARCFDGVRNALSLFGNVLAFPRRVAATDDACLKCPRRFLDEWRELTARSMAQGKTPFEVCSDLSIRELILQVRKTHTHTHMRTHARTHTHNTHTQTQTHVIPFHCSLSRKSLLISFSRCFLSEVVVFFSLLLSV